MNTRFSRTNTEGLRRLAFIKRWAATAEIGLRSRKSLKVCFMPDLLPCMKKSIRPRIKAKMANVVHSLANVYKANFQG